MNTDIFTNIVQLALTCGIGVVAFFLKRTISELDICKQNISDIKEKFIKRSELDECKKDIAQVKADYITREDFFREQDNTQTTG